MTIPHRHALLAVCGFFVLGGSPQHAQAQLNECALIDAAGLIDAPGGCIEKSLAMQVGPGHGDANTPGSSTYLIARDPARAIRRGRQLPSSDDPQNPVNHGSIALGSLFQISSEGVE